MKRLFLFIPRSPAQSPRRRKEVRDPYDGLRPWSAITHGIGAGLAVIGTLLLVGRSLWGGELVPRRGLSDLRPVHDLSVHRQHPVPLRQHLGDQSGSPFGSTTTAPSICSSPGATPPSAPPSSGRTAGSHLLSVIWALAFAGDHPHHRQAGHSPLAHQRHLSGDGLAVLDSRRPSGAAAAHGGDGVAGSGRRAVHRGRRAVRGEVAGAGTTPASAATRSSTCSSSWAPCAISSSCTR